MFDLPVIVLRLPHRLTGDTSPGLKSSKALLMIARPAT
jgi:hypothetical protein